MDVNRYPRGPSYPAAQTERGPVTAWRSGRRRGGADRNGASSPRRRYRVASAGMLPPRLGSTASGRPTSPASTCPLHDFAAQSVADSQCGCCALRHSSWRSMKGEDSADRNRSASTQRGCSLQEKAIARATPMSLAPLWCQVSG